jgi:hypothetical protein
LTVRRRHLTWRTSLSTSSDASAAASSPPASQNSPATCGPLRSSQPEVRIIRSTKRRAARPLSRSDEHPHPEIGNGRNDVQACSNRIQPRLDVSGYGVLRAVCSGAETAPPFLVASTLDGKTVLPHRIVWRGVPPITPWASVPIPHSTRCAKTQICPSWSLAVNLRSPAGDISRSGTSAPAARARS